MARGKKRSNGVATIVRAGKRPTRFTNDLFAPQQTQRTIGIVSRRPPTGRIVEALDRRPAAARQNTVKAGLGGIGDDEAVAR